MRRALFVIVVLGLLCGASSALANNMFGLWLARDQNQEVFLALSPNGTYQYRYTTVQQTYNEQGRYQLQGQNMYVQPFNNPQGYTVQLQMSSPNTLEIYRNGQFFAQLARVDNQGNLIGGQGGMQQGGMQQGGMQQGGMPQGGGMQGGGMQGGGMQGGGMQGGGMQGGGMQGGGMQGGGALPGQQGGGVAPPVQTGPSKQAEEFCEKGWALFKKDMHPQALEAFNQAIALYPGYDDAYLGRALNYGSMGHSDKAVADLNQVLQINPQKNVVYYFRAVAFTEQGMLDKALADAEEFIRLEPGDKDGPELREKILKRKAAKPSGGNRPGTGGQAGGTEQPASSQAAAQSREHTKRAWGLYDQKRYDEAIAAVTQAIAIDPRNADAYQIRAMSHREKGEHAQSAADYTKVLEITPQNHTALYQRGAAYARSKMWDQAMADAEEFIRRQPDDPDGPKLREAILKLKQKDASGAGRTSGAAGQSGDGKSAAFSLVGKAIKAWEQGQHDQAMRLYDQAVAASPHYSLALSCRARALVSLGEFDKAAADATVIMRVDPAHNGAYLTRAHAYRNLDRLDEALADVEEYIRREPSEEAGPQLRDQILTQKRARATGSRLPAGGGAPSRRAPRTARRA